VKTGPHGPFDYPDFLRVAQFMNASYDSRKILRVAKARQCAGAIKFSVQLKVATRAWGAKKK
jgi:hypothetical protein